MQIEERPTQPNTTIFELAAAVLSGDGSLLDPEMETKARGFLDVLGYSKDDDARHLSKDIVGNRVSLLRSAAVMGGIFRLHGRCAAGLTFFGAKAVPPQLSSNVERLSASLNGAGETPGEAFEACIGEGIEYLSQFLHSNEHLYTGTFEDVAPWKATWRSEPVLDWLDHKKTSKSSAVEWIAARRLLDNEPGWLPAIMVLRDPNTSLHLEQRLALGCGCAAGASWAAAVTSALLEVLERDAVALWWKGGRPGRAVGLETLATGARDLIGRIRNGSNERVTTLIDISSEFEIPCVAAISFNRDGRGFAAGFACRLNAAQACKAAIVEMCQMELGHDVVAAKRASLGADSLNEADIRQERRRTELRPNLAGLVDGLLGPASLQGLQTLDLSDVVSRLASAGFHVYAADLTRPEFAVPVARVIVPGLQPYPSTFVSSRLAEASSAASHKTPYASGIDLF